MSLSTHVYKWTQVLERIRIKKQASFTPLLDSVTTDGFWTVCIALWLIMLCKNPQLQSLTAGGETEENWEAVPVTKIFLRPTDSNKIRQILEQQGFEDLSDYAFEMLMSFSVIENERWANLYLSSSEESVTMSILGEPEDTVKQYLPMLLEKLRNILQDANILDLLTITVEHSIEDFS